MCESYHIQQAIKEIKATYGHNVSVDAKAKQLRKFGENQNVGTGLTVIMTLPTGITEEITLTSNGITHAVSSSTSDVGKSVVYEGHTISGGNLTFSAPPYFDLNGRTPVQLPVPLARATRALLLNGVTCAGDVSFYEGGAVTNGVPNDADQVHLIIPATEPQTQKTSTSISSIDYWIITHMSLSVLEKTGSWAQGRIEAKNCLSNTWLPKTQYFGVSDAQGTISFDLIPHVIIPRNSDFRVAAKANTAGIHVAAGVSGYLAVII